eukprot:m.1512916 g.1512916  ORF g.1512916 m.1512916 type:complete len:141 (+) comp25213_c0_seq42:637-1059(+)
MLKEIARVVAATESVSSEATRSEIEEYVCAALPMGTVMVVAADVSAALNGPSRPQVKNPTQNRTAHVEKQPAWRLNPVQGKTRNTVHVAVNEYVRAVQYDRDDTPDICEVYGSLHCKADTDGIVKCLCSTYTIVYTQADG